MRHHLLRNRFSIVFFVVVSISFLASCSESEFSRRFAPHQGIVTEYEFPQRQELCLNGLWQFQPANVPSDWKSGQGVPPVLPLPSDDKWEAVPIKIPSPWNVNSVLHDQRGQGMDSRTFPSYPKHWNDAKMGWLRKKFTIPDQWKGNRVFIHLDAVAGDCRIIINGKDMGLHFDPSLPGQFDITSAVLWGQDNDILLGIRDAKLYSEKGKYGSFTYPTGSFWLTDAIGVWQDVFLLAKPQVHVADVFIQPLLDKDILVAQVELVNDTAKKQHVKLDIPVYEWINHTDLSKKNMLKAPEISWSLGQEVLRLSSSSIELEPGRKKIVTLKETVKGRLKKWEVWTRGKPNLYAAISQIHSNGNVIDKKYQRFGWREVKLHEGDFLLNGERLQLMHEGWHFTGIPTLTRRYAWGWYMLAKEANVNFVRPHAMPHPGFFYDMADEMGMLIMGESGIFASHCELNYESDDFWRRSRRHIENLVRRDRNHPSIVGWSVANEVRCVLIWKAADDLGFQQQVYDKIYDLCKLARSTDPTRQWVQSDGDKDLDGRLDVFTIHCGEKYDDVIPPKKLWGVTEGGSSYYGKPGHYEQYVGDKAYRSFEDRMDALAMECYNLMRVLRQDNADICVGWNLAWHGIKPLPVGLKNISAKKLSLTDGIFFGPYLEGQPGVQPERIAPFSTTINPGWDSSLSLFEPYPLYTALKASMHPDGPRSCKWDRFDAPESLQPAPKIADPMTQTSFVGNTQNAIYDNLKSMGVPFGQSSQFMIIDITSIEAYDIDTLKKNTDHIVQKGGTVLLFGVSPDTQKIANIILPQKITCVEDTASSLVPNLEDQRTACLSYKELYFAENFMNKVISRYSLTGDLIEKGKILLCQNNTDWRRWLNAPEYSKTISIYRSELENKKTPVLVEYQKGQGRYLVSTLELNNLSDDHVNLYRKLLTNFGLKLKERSKLTIPAFDGNVLVSALSLGRFGSDTIEAAIEKEFIDETSIQPVENARLAGKVWKIKANAGDRFVLNQLSQDGPTDIYVTYFSYWVHSPIDLSDLLSSGPDLPQVTQFCYVSDQARVYLNGIAIKPTASEPADYRTRLIYDRVPLKKGWNHFLIKVASDSLVNTDPGTLAVRLLSNNESYNKQLKTALQIVK
ncbi:MAG: hypothetical protein KAJ07_07710 [Planctomycetes bacterium]|nr:hypothetical protein [Planctomycetota bacterium]